MTVGDRLLDTPVICRRDSLCERDILDGTGSDVVVIATKREFSVARGLGGRDEEDAKHFLRNQFLRKKIIRHGRDYVGIAHGVNSQIDGANAEDAIQTLEAGGCISRADRLVFDHQAGGECDCIEPLLSEETSGTITAKL